MRDRLVIIGAGGHGKVVADIAIKMNQWRNFYFLDDNRALKHVLGYNVLGRISDYREFINNDTDIFVAIGDNRLREVIQDNLEKAGASIPTLIHPNAVLGIDVEVDSGTVVMAGAVINCCTKIGKGCIINTGATVDHDNVIDDYVHISPGVNIGGKVHIGKGTWLGIGSKVINNIGITGGCVIGAGTVVIRYITEQGTYVGVPARKINV